MLNLVPFSRARGGMVYINPEKVVSVRSAPDSTGGTTGGTYTEITLESWVVEVHGDLELVVGALIDGSMQ